MVVVRDPGTSFEGLFVDCVLKGWYLVIWSQTGKHRLEMQAWPIGGGVSWWL